MSASNVRNIDSLAAMQAGMVRLSDDWSKTVQELRSMVQRAEEYFSQTQPQYWRHQLQLAEREINEAKDDLARKRASLRPEDRPAASEAVARVQKAERRLRYCEDKRRQLRSWTIEVSKVCDDLRGPLADMNEHCDTLLPQAARELGTLIEQLRIYAEQARRSDA
ncbi:hypothetical protein [Novipirellula caenicola]|uniref:Chromosome partition protein Smc n=1 Tax=Novipirellula caenicola TaxID=1536901 RepID=A0ABP9VRM2_9BACT